MVCGLLGAKPLPGSILIYFQLAIHLSAILVKFKYLELGNFIENAVCTILDIFSDPSRDHFH